MKTCQILADAHEHAGRPCVKGDRIELAAAVAEMLAQCVPPVVKILPAAPNPAAVPRHSTTIKKGP